MYKYIFSVWPLTFRWKWGWDITHVDEIWYPHETEGSLGVVSWKTSSRPPTNVGQIWREQAKLGIGVRSLIFTRRKTLQDAGDNREHVWKGDGEQDIQIFKWLFLTLQNIWWNLTLFGKWRVLGSLEGTLHLVQDVLVLIGLYICRKFFFDERGGTLYQKTYFYHLYYVIPKNSAYKTL